MKKLLVICGVAATLGANAATTPLWLRDVKISPDGKAIAFTYKGDIYTVPAAGGEARRITSRQSYECNPVWAPDGKTIAFASDRHGNFDVFVVDADGGTPRRLTTHSAAEIPESFGTDGKSVLYSASIQDPAESALFPSGRMTELYRVPVNGGVSEQVMATPVQHPTFSANGEWMIYQDVKGFEDEWRKHHTSSVTRDLWRYDFKTGAHTNITDRGGEDRDPVLSPDNSTVYFLSERDGKSFNIYAAPVSDMAAAKAVTEFKTHPVRFLSGAADGKLAFTYDGEIYTLNPGAKPQKVKISLTTDDDISTERINAKPSAGAVSPDGKQVAFLSRGEVFVTSEKYATTKQITHTPQAERHLTWGDDRTLYYTSERDGHFNIYKAEISREEEPNFANTTIIKETAVLPSKDGIERTYPRLSPDGKSLAFIQDRNKLMVMDVKSGKVKQLTDGSTYARRNGGFDYQWSPDSKWITLEVIDNHHDPYTDIAIINVADGTMTNLTGSGYVDAAPRFVLDGNAILFISERYGMRAHASWGSQDDVMLVFLNQDAFDRFQLSEEDYALKKEIDRQAKKKTADGDKEKKEVVGDSNDNNIKVELDGIADRTVRLTPYSSSLADAIVSPDGETLYYMSKFEKGYDLWKLPLRKKEPKLVAKPDAGAASLQVDKEGKALYLMGTAMKKMDLKSEKLTGITSSATMEVDHAAEREYMFDYVYRQEKEMFYDKGMHGVDWHRMTADYRKFLPHINNNYDFAEMLSELLGELNVSHTGGRYRAPASAQADRTATLGLLYDMQYRGKGIKVAEVIKNGPFDKSWSKVKPGLIIEKINGEEITPDSDHAAMFNNIAGKKTLVSVFNPESGERFDEVVLPITASRHSDLLYKRWVAQRAADVDRWSDGRLGYVHIESMNDDSFRPVYSDILGKYNDREGIVIDIRWNGGGRMHEDIEVLFSGKKYFTQVVRGVETCDMPSRRWNKPSIMVQAEACYSNAHGTPWVYSHQGLGKLVGMPVPGTMTSVNWITMQDPTLVFGIPVVGYRLPDGSYLENSQLEPDVKVVNAPETIVKGEDTQLKKAVETLLHDIDSKKHK